MIYIYSENKKFDTDAQNLTAHLNLVSGKDDFAVFLKRDEDSDEEPMKAELRLCYRKKGLSLECGSLSLIEDFESMLPRIKDEMWKHEYLAKAASFKGYNSKENLKAIDATAGLGEDSLILAAAGFNVLLFERNPVIAALLKDAIRRAKKNQILKDIVSRMKVTEGDSIEMMPKLDGQFDVVYLDPMFPERQKSALIKKKFQLLHMLESPSMDEDALLKAAMQVNAKKIIIKRPPKGPFVAGIKPGYSITGKAVRFDCLT